MPEVSIKRTSRIIGSTYGLGGVCNNLWAGPGWPCSMCVLDQYVGLSLQDCIGCLML